MNTKNNYICPKYFTVVLSISAVLISMSPTWALDREAAFRYPVRAYNDGNYRVAIRGFNQFLGEFPDDSRVNQIRFWKSEAHMQLEDWRKAYDILFSLHEENPVFRQDEVLTRLSFLAEKLDRKGEVMELYSSRSLSRTAKLQNYLIKWLLDRNQPQELYSQLSLIEDGSLTDTAQEFLRDYSRSQTMESVQDRLFRGQWDNQIRQELQLLPEVARRNVLTLGARNLWNNGNHQSLVGLGNNVPENWWSPEFQLYYAEASIKEDELKRAESIYRDLLEQPKYRAETHFSLAWVLYQQGKTEQAREFLEEISWGEVTEPFSAEAVRLLGDIRLESGDTAGAQQSYRIAMKMSDDQSLQNQTRYWLGWALFESGQVRAAYRAFNNVSAEGDIKLSDVYQARGRTALETGRYEQAEENYRQALGFTGDSQKKKVLRYELAQTLYEQGRMEAAFDRLLRLDDEELNPELSTSVDMALARTAFEMGQYNLADSIFRNNESALREQFPREYLYFAGSAAVEIDQLARASALLDELLNEYPDSPFGRTARRMKFQVQLERLDLTDQDQQKRLRQTIEQSPPEIRLSLLRRWAESLIENQLYDQGRALFEEVLTKTNDPAERAGAIDSVVSLELNRDREKQAFEFLESRLKELPSHPSASQAVYRLIRHDYRNEKLNRLDQWIQRFLEQFQQSPYHGHVHFMAGEVARNAGKITDAARHYRKGLEHDPNPEIQARIKFRIAQADVRERRFSEAIPHLETLTDRTLEFVSQSRLNSMLAEAYFETDQPQKALDRLSGKSERTDFDNLILSRIHLDRGNLSRARRYLQQMDPPERSVLHAEKRFVQGKIEQVTGNQEEAETIWYETFYLYPNWSQRDRLIFHLAKLLDGVGKHQEAKKLRQRLENESPTSPYREQVN